MKCKQCNYEHGWSSEENKTIEGDLGSFYELTNNIRLRRGHCRDTEYVDLYVCPKCGNVFTEIE